MGWVCCCREEEGIGGRVGCRGRGDVDERKGHGEIIFFFKRETAYDVSACLVGSEVCIKDRALGWPYCP